MRYSTPRGRLAAGGPWLPVVYGGRPAFAHHLQRDAQAVGRHARDNASQGGRSNVHDRDTGPACAAQPPPFRADHVGSLLRPRELVAARAARKAGTLSADALRAVEDRCIEAAIRRQEDLGLRAATDGEYRRAYWHYDFVSGLDEEDPVQGRLRRAACAADHRKGRLGQADDGG